MRSLFDLMQTSPAPAPIVPATPAVRAHGGTRAVDVGNVSGIVELLAHAKARGLKYPKLWLQLDASTPLRITIAGPSSRTPGYLVLTDGGPFDSNRYFGRISPQGFYEVGRDGFTRQAQLGPLLNRLSADPAGVAAEYGHLTGNCCFCSRRLSDERSTVVGYGPIYAEKFGVPWGAGT